MKVMKGMDTKRATPPHPRSEGGAALREGIKQLDANYAENKRMEPVRPGHRSSKED